MSKKVRWWVVTQWDTSKTAEDYQACIDDGWAKFIAWGNETTKSGKPHHQMFLYFTDSRDRNKSEATAKYMVKKMKLSKHPHCAAMNGTVHDNEVYCSKESELQKVGEMPAQGKRTDIESLKERIVAGELVEDMMMENAMTFHMYGRTLQAIEDKVNRSKRRTNMTEAFWLWGATGSGKSHLAHNIDIPFNQIYARDSDGAWWDDYCGQELVVMDDYRANLPFNIMLKIADKWPFSVARRNRKPYPFTSTAVIITSHRRPEDTYPGCEEDFQQFYRRYRVYEFTADGRIKRTLQRENFPRCEETPQKCSEGNTEPLITPLGKKIQAAIDSRSAANIKDVE
jgi:hypothetical protein